jgi:hypothetical protein
MAVEPLEVCFPWEAFGWRALCLQKCCCCEETSCVCAEVLAVSFTLLLVYTMKWSGRILDSLFAVMTFLKNHQYTLSLNQIIVFTQQQNSNSSRNNHNNNKC